jgi:peptidoglycan/xylan/chitin deacetylase (PgdA/CDA1 family)
VTVGGRRVVSLLYHDVVDGDPDGSGFAGAGAAHYKLGTAEFRAHLAALRTRVARPPVLVTGMSDADDSPLLITFDDGGVSALHPTHDLRAELNWPGHFFVTAERIGAPGFLGGEEVRALAAAGHVIGSHSWSHPARISALPYERIVDEWRRSRSRLEDVLGQPVTVASVPGGFHSSAVASAAAETGIGILFTSEPTAAVRREAGMLVLGRYSLRRGDDPALAVSLATGSGLARTRQWLRWNAARPLKKLAGPAYIAVRERLLRRNVVGN